MNIFQKSLGLLLISFVPLMSAITIDVQNTPWNDANWVSHQEDIQVCNSHNTGIVVDGVRFLTPEASAWSSTLPVDGRDLTYEYLLPDYKKRLGGKACLKMDAGFSGTPKGQDWTPTSAQSLIKTGYCDALTETPQSDVFTCQEAFQSTSNSGYYDKNYCQTDGYGTRGGPMSGGWIDTWVGETQIQVAIPTVPFNQNNTWVTFEPDEMGGPMYMMALAMGQEYMNMDMQFMIGIAGGENFTGMVHWETMGEKAGFRTGNLLYGTGNNGKNGVDYGPFSIEPATIGDNVIKSYPSFFPEYPTLSEDPAFGGVSGAQIAQQYMETPGTGMIQPNAPELVNSVIISGLNLWFIYDLIANATDFCMLEVIREGADSLAAMKMMGKAYNKGINSAFESPFTDPSAKDMENITPLLGAGGGFYVEKALKGSNPLVEAMSQSQTCGGDIPIYDSWIDLVTLKSFFFGTQGTPSSLGSGGLMHHFSADIATREEMWNEITCTFNQLSSHWNEDTPSISYRYDFLTILRVARKYFSTERPLPNNFTYTNWLKTRTKNPVSCSGVTIDREYPFWDIKSKVQSGDMDITLKVQDNLEIGQVQWSLGDEWITWNEAEYLNGESERKANYSVKIPQSLIQEKGASESHWVWIKATDQCGNSTIGKTILEGQSIPSLDSASAIDNDGDGQADEILIYGQEYQGDQKEGQIYLNQWDSIAYQWPSLNSSKNQQRGLLNGAQFQILDEQLQGGSGLGQATVFITGGPLTTSIQDRVGPVIKYAAIKEYDHRNDADSLIILFSEGVDIKKELDAIYLTIDNNDISSSDVVIKESNLAYFIFPRGTIAEGQMVKISTAERIQDLENNLPLINNQEQKIILDEGPVPLASSGHGYFDRNQDGRLDRLTLNFERIVGDKQLDIQFNWKDSNAQVQTFTLKTTDANIDNTTITWDLEDGLELMEGTTYYDPNESNWGIVQVNQLELETGKDFTQEIYPQDKMSPVALRAILQQAQEIGGDDDIKIAYSEPINHDKVTSDQLYIIHTKGRSDRKPIHQNPQKGKWNAAKTFSILSFSGEQSERPQISDSLSLNSETFGGIIDPSNNPASFGNPKVLIEGKPTVQFYSPQLTTIKDFTKKDARIQVMTPLERLEATETLGAGVGFEFSFQEPAGSSRKDIEINISSYYYTNLGQFVRKVEHNLNCSDLENLGYHGACDPELLPPSQKISLFQLWNYRDQTGRTVGSGAYILKSTIKVIRNEIFEAKFDRIIGVRR